MMTNLDAIEFACASARTAFDQAGAYDDSIANFRENLIDTMNDEKVGQFDYHAALAAYDDTVLREAAKATPEVAAKLVVRKLIDLAETAGFKPVKVNDGDIVPVRNAGEMMDAVFAVDECTVYFKRDGDAKAHCAVIVLGNMGWDAVADHSVGPGWDAVMDRLTDWTETLGV